jgi:hypothetical protein
MILHGVVLAGYAIWNHVSYGRIRIYAMKFGDPDKSYTSHGQVIKLLRSVVPYFEGQELVVAKKNLRHLIIIRRTAIGVIIFHIMAPLLIWRWLD